MPPNMISRMRQILHSITLDKVPIHRRNDNRDAFFLGSSVSLQELQQDVVGSLDVCTQGVAHSGCVSLP